MSNQNTNNWLYGIPDFSLAQDFTYFNDLLGESRNFQLAYRKANLYSQAHSAAEAAGSALQSAPSLETALDFIGLIASNERTKEIQVVKSYCDRIGKQYPAFTNWSEDAILSDPNGFYKQLTEYINYAKQQATEYQEELERIKRNSGQVKNITRKKSRSEYAKENYLYRLASDTESLIKKMIGTFSGNKNSEESFSSKLQDVVMEILKSQNIPKLIQSGEDFAAIAVSVLADIEQRVQARFDKETKKTDGPKQIEQLQDEIIKDIQQAYIDDINNGTGSGVQQALTNINGDDFIRVTQNAKQVLGIKQIEDPNKAKEQIDEVARLASERKTRRRSQDRLVNHIRASFSRRASLVNSLQTLEFRNTSSETFHGNLYELVESVISEKGFQLGNSGSAVDVITLTINTDQKNNTNAISGFATDISKEITKFAQETTHEDDILTRDLSSAVTNMNDNIDNTLRQLDKFLQDAGTEQPLFIFHESLKLYSSIETGKSSSFSGRTLNILAALDYIYSAMNSVGITFPGSLDLMRMLALNLSDLAVGGGKKGTLEYYLSLFAGLLMFDDIVNMAQEAIGTIEYSTVNVVHLYLLNGIYVPSSAILTYISENLAAGLNTITAGEAASATISTGGADKAISTWLDTPELGSTPKIWSKVASNVASGTQVHIAFFAGFLKFISML